MPLFGLDDDGFDDGPVSNLPFEEDRRLAAQFRVYVLTSAAIPALLAVLVWRVRAERLDHFGEVEYGVPDAANGTRTDTFCETYPCWETPDGGLLTQPWSSVCVFLLAAVYLVAGAHLFPRRRFRACFASARDFSRFDKPADWPHAWSRDRILDYSESAGRRVGPCLKKTVEIDRARARDDVTFVFSRPDLENAQEPVSGDAAGRRRRGPAPAPPPAVVPRDGEAAPRAGPVPLSAGVESEDVFPIATRARQGTRGASGGASR